MRITELIPTNGRKSFYGKAKVIETDNEIKLLSYNTIVAEYNKDTNQYKENGKYSQTTSAHINAFKKYLGID